MTKEFGSGKKLADLDPTAKTVDLSTKRILFGGEAFLYEP